LRFRAKSNKYLAISTTLIVLKLKTLGPFSKEKPNWSLSPQTSATTTGKQESVPPMTVQTSRWILEVDRLAYFSETKEIGRS